MSHSMSGYTSGSSRTPSTSGPPPSYDGKSFAMFFLCRSAHDKKYWGRKLCGVFICYFLWRYLVYLLNTNDYCCLLYKMNEGKSTLSL